MQAVKAFGLLLVQQFFRICIVILAHTCIPERREQVILNSVINGLIYLFFLLLDIQPIIFAYSAVPSLSFPNVRSSYTILSGPVDASRGMTLLSQPGIRNVT